MLGCVDVMLLDEICRVADLDERTEVAFSYWRH